MPLDFCPVTIKTIWKMLGEAYDGDEASSSGL